MHPHLPPAVVYECIIPVDESLITPSAAYHSPLDEPGGVPQKLPFPAYPDIRKSSQPLCFPTVRSVYFPLHSSNLSPEKAQAVAAQYLAQHPDISDPALLEQIVTESNAHFHAWQELIKTGKFPQEYSLPTFIDSYTTPLIKSLNEMGAFAGGKAARAIWQSQVHGAFPVFYGASDAFAYVHEFAHRFAMWLYSGVLIREQAVHIYYGLNRLMRNPEISLYEALESWKLFESAHSNLINLAKKFEPIEEIFAVYLGMIFLPSTVRETILDKIEQALSKRNWFKAYEVFAKACDTCQVYPPIGAAVSIAEMVCRLLEHIDTNATSVIEAVVSNFQICWKIKQKETEGESLTDEDEDAADEILTKTLEEAGIPLEVAELIHGSDSPHLERLSDAIEHNFSRPEDKDVLSPIIMLIGFLSKHQITPFIFPQPTEEDPNGLTLYEKIFFDSIRQQLAHSFAITRQKLTLPCNLICPFAFKGQRCCGSKEELSMLYNRLPEEVRTQVIPPNCDLIR
jgi:hypothetical protein